MKTRKEKRLKEKEGLEIKVLCLCQASHDSNWINNSCPMNGFPINISLSFSSMNMH